MSETTQTRSAFGVLRQFVRRPSSLERCEMCSKELAAGHQHLLEPINRKLICACDACAILFSNQGQTKYKRVPRRVRFLANFQMTDSQWDGLLMPINMAFFFKSTPQNRVIALYPSPAGATESLLSFDTWDEIELENPVLLEMEADVEALLVNRIGHARGFSDAEYYVVPIDECFKLVGLIRSQWQGLSGGTEVWREIAQFFGDLKAKSRRWRRGPVPDLGITVEKAEVVPFAASPTLAFKLRVSNADEAETIHTVVLRCQIQIEVSRRLYTALDQERLRDLFGEPERWGQTLRNLLWTNTSAVIPQFTGVTAVDLQVPCTFDFSVATTKYFNGLADGDIPVCLMFSGTVFYAGPDGALRVAPISWDKETKFRLPLRVWKDMMDAYYPNSAWLCLRRDIFEDLHRFKVERGIPTWEQAFETMLSALKEAVGKEEVVRS